MISVQYGPDVFLPIRYKLDSDGGDFHQSLIASTPRLTVIDLFESQRKELIRVQRPSETIEAVALDAYYRDSIAHAREEQLGTWVYYPWLRTLIRILDRAEFIDLRTSRNRFKITDGEQKALSEKSVGIIGLSVGHAVAMCMATERAAGRFRLADFDTIETSNLNRIGIGLSHVGLNKAVSTARAMLEIDPYLDVQCHTEGVTASTLDAFLAEGGRVDVLVDECDSLDVKILCREAARRHRIPVLMETSDRGLLDVERFDLEPERPILHGLLGDVRAEQVRGLSTQDKIPLVLKVLDVTSMSLRGKASLLEVGSSISTWPQLASAVTLGGAVVTDVARRVLLGRPVGSGRSYIDLEALVQEESTSSVALVQRPLRKDDEGYRTAGGAMSIGAIDATGATTRSETLRPREPGLDLRGELVQDLVSRANLAPSGANFQPWRWVWRRGVLQLLHDRSRSRSFGDFGGAAPNIAFGAALENLRLAAWSADLHAGMDFFPHGDEADLVCEVRFRPLTADAARETNITSQALVDAISRRCTTRTPSRADVLSDLDRAVLQTAVQSVPGARLDLIGDEAAKIALGRVIGGCDRVRLLHPRCQFELMTQELRWTPAQAEAARDGLDLRTLGMTPAFEATLSMLKDERVTAFLKQIDGGRALVDLAIKSTRSASVLGMITLPTYTPMSFVNGGIAMQRMWLQATLLDYALLPLMAPFFLFPRIVHGAGTGFDEAEARELRRLREEMSAVVPLSDHGAEVFLFKLARAPACEIPSKRRRVEDTLTFSNIDA